MKTEDDVGWRHESNAMFYLRRITLWNFKRFGPLGEAIDLAPTTFLYGANSAGKSSVIQALLTLSQSWERLEDIRELRLEGPKVALGDFRNVVHRHQSQGLIGIGIDVSKTDAVDDALNVPCIFWFSGTDDSVAGRLDRIEFMLGGRKYHALPVTQERGQRRHDEPVPLLLEVRDPDGEAVLRDWLSERGLEVSPDRSVDADEDINAESRGLAREYLMATDTVWDETKLALIRFAFSAYPELELDGDALGISLKGADSAIANMADDSGKWDLLQRVSIFEGALKRIRRLILGVRHVGPIRRLGSRLITFSGRAISTVGEDGRHTVEVLAAQPAVLNRVNTMLADMNVPHQLHLERPGRAIELRLKHVTDPPLAVNETESATSVENAPRVLAVVGHGDVGSGIAQMLPVLAEWCLAFEDAQLGDTVPLVCLEQPELHTHPRLHGELALKLAGHGRPEGSDSPQVIIETHAENMALMIAQQVHEEGVDPNSVVFVVFSESDEGEIRTNALRIRLDGSLDGPWPGGFFPERLDIMSP